MNIDKVYTMEHFVQPGETIASLAYHKFCGGKGLNQSIAASLAGAVVYHAGKVGDDGKMLIDRLEEANVITRDISYYSGSSGHAVIQVDKTGQNCIILYGGANQEITKDDVDRVFQSFHMGDILVVQNETSSLQYILKKAAEKEMTIAMNPSPISDELLQMDLSMVHYFLMNEIEGKAFTGKENPTEICTAMLEKYNGCKVVLTLGNEGVMYKDDVQTLTHGVYQVSIVDTTAAGDTFTGYFLACLTEGMPVALALEKASKAAALAISRNGASDSIPTRAEVDTTAIHLAN